MKIVLVMVGLLFGSSAFANAELSSAASDLNSFWGYGGYERVCRGHGNDNCRPVYRPYSRPARRAVRISRCREGKIISTTERVCRRGRDNCYHRPINMICRNGIWVKYRRR